MYCNNCNSELEDNFAFCPKCGNKLKIKEADKYKKTTIKILSILFIVIFAFALLAIADINNFESRAFSDYFNPNLGQVGIQTEYLNDKKVLVKSVLPNSPAAKAGIKADDKIIEVDNSKINNIYVFEAKMRGVPNSTVNIKLLRNGTEKEYTVTRENIVAKDGYYELLDKVYLRQDYLKYDNGVYYFWIKTLPGAWGNKIQDNNIGHIVYLIGVDVVRQKYSEPEIYVYDKKGNLIDSQTQPDKDIKFDSIAPNTVAHNFLLFARMLDAEIPNRYKKKLKGYFN